MVIRSIKCTILFVLFFVGAPVFAEGADMPKSAADDRSANTTPSESCREVLKVVGDTLKLCCEGKEYIPGVYNCTNFSAAAAEKVCFSAGNSCFFLNSCCPNERGNNCHAMFAILIEGRWYLVDPGEGKIYDDVSAASPTEFNAAKVCEKRGIKTDKTPTIVLQPWPPHPNTDPRYCSAVHGFNRDHCADCCKTMTKDCRDLGGKDCSVFEDKCGDRCREFYPLDERPSSEICSATYTNNTGNCVGCCYAFFSIYGVFRDSEPPRISPGFHKDWVVPCINSCNKLCEAAKEKGESWKCGQKPAYVCKDDPAVKDLKGCKSCCDNFVANNPLKRAEWCESASNEICLGKHWACSDYCGDRFK